jgi:hypothetical protein
VKTVVNSDLGRMGEVAIMSFKLLFQQSPEWTGCFFVTDELHEFLCSEQHT